MLFISSLFFPPENGEDSILPSSLPPSWIVLRSSDSLTASSGMRACPAVWKLQAIRSCHAICRIHTSGKGFSSSPTAFPIAKGFPCRTVLSRQGASLNPPSCCNPPFLRVLAYNIRDYLTGNYYPHRRRHELAGRRDSSPCLVSKLLPGDYRRLVRKNGFKSLYPQPFKP